MSGCEEVNYYFRKAARVMGLSAHVERMLVTPFREVKVDVSITLDNGELGTFIGYRVQHDNSRGPMKGGLRYHPTVDMDEAQGLASLMPSRTSSGRRTSSSSRGTRSASPASWAGTCVKPMRRCRAWCGSARCRSVLRRSSWPSAEWAGRLC